MTATTTTLREFLEGIGQEVEDFEEGKQIYLVVSKFEGLIYMNGMLTCFNVQKLSCSSRKRFHLRI